MKQQLTITLTGGRKRRVENIQEQQKIAMTKLEELGQQVVQSLNSAGFAKQAE